MRALLDANVLIALAVEDHVHHSAAEQWLTSRSDQTFATTPITQGALLRLLLRHGLSSTDAMLVLNSFLTDPRYEMWADDQPFTSQTMRGVIGHRQVTDAYLAAITRSKNCALATLDEGLLAAHPDVTERVMPPR